MTREDAYIEMLKGKSIRNEDWVDDGNCVFACERLNGNIDFIFSYDGTVENSRFLNMGMKGCKGYVEVEDL